MNSMDGVNQARNPLPGERPATLPADIRKAAKNAEEYVMIENRLAAQHEKPANSAQYTSIFDQLRDRLGK